MWSCIVFYSFQESDWQAADGMDQCPVPLVSRSSFRFDGTQCTINILKVLIIDIVKNNNFSVITRYRLTRNMWSSFSCLLSDISITITNIKHESIVLLKYFSTDTLTPRLACFLSCVQVIAIKKVMVKNKTYPEVQVVGFCTLLPLFERF